MIRTSPLHQLFLLDAAGNVCATVCCNSNELANDVCAAIRDQFAGTDRNAMKICALDERGSMASGELTME